MRGVMLEGNLCGFDDMGRIFGVCCEPKDDVWCVKHIMCTSK